VEFERWWASSSSWGDMKKDAMPVYGFVSWNLEF
jgi:hypothetical protein